MLSVVRESIFNSMPSWLPILRSMGSSYSSMGSLGSQTQTTVVVSVAAKGLKPGDHLRMDKNCCLMN